MINPLRQLLASPVTTYTAGQIIAFERATQYDWAQFCNRLAAWEQLFIQAKGDLIALYMENSLDFAAALLAIWRLGKQALIPANILPATCTQIAAITSCFAGDFIGIEALQPSPADVPKVPAITAICEAKAVALVLFTSGSTSQPIPVSKTFAQLEAEIEALEVQWGNRLSGAYIVSTVSHHHIYGLLFRLLWPLCTGRPFAIRSRNYWEELAQDAQAQQPLAIVSSPAHLSRVPSLAWPISAVVAIFSSGAPLAKQAALTTKGLLGQPVTEVFGSTETGGIGWREQDIQTCWSCLPNVEIKLDDAGTLLQVRSNHLPSSDWFTSSDQAKLDEQGRFSLCGRADRIAKVGGKRISITAIEHILEQQPGVAQVRIIPLPERGERLAAVVILNNDGNKHLIDQGKSAISRWLKSTLEDQIERIAIPRYWRYLGELPQNRQAKTTLANLQGLFSREPLPRLPELIAHSWTKDTLLLELFVPTNLYYFDGHFLGRPVLPGVVQTHWAVHYGREYFGALGEFSSLEAIKFQQIITANQNLQLRLKYQAANCKLYFAYTSYKGDAEFTHASGRIAFEVEPNNV